MTKRERLMRIIQGKTPDRPAVKLWGARPGSRIIHPAYGPVLKLALELTDLGGKVENTFDVIAGRHQDLYEKFREIRNSDKCVDEIIRINTPKGTLNSICTYNTAGEYGFQTEYMVKEPEDLEKILAIPYLAQPFNGDSYYESEKALGDRGVTIYLINTPVNLLYRLIGSENLAIWSIDCRDLLLEVIRVFSGRIREHILSVFKAGIKPVFGWNGHEICIPPLMSFTDFNEFSFQFDKPLTDLMHEGGGHVWAHCHGKIGLFLEKFIEMGVDVLQPVEPPPLGDVTLEEAFNRVGSKMALEGNIQFDELMNANTDRICDLVHEAMEAGSKTGRRFVLCQSAGFMGYPNPNERMIQNVLTYIREGVSSAEKYRKF